MTKFKKCLVVGIGLGLSRYRGLGLSVWSGLTTGASPGHRIAAKLGVEVYAGQPGPANAKASNPKQPPSLNASSS